MILSAITDPHLVQSFMTIDEVWNLASDDCGISKDSYMPEFSAERAWLGVYEGIVMIGMIYVHKQTTCAIQMHPYLLSGHKHKIREVTRLFFSWAFNMQNVHKINVTIPFMYKKLRNCCLKVGFKDEGINRLSYQKGGVLMDQWHMGVTRGDL